MKTQASTENRLFALVERELVLPARSVHAATPIAGLGDSLDWLELLIAIEEDFGVDSEPAQTKSIGTVADLLRVLQQAPTDVPDVPPVPPVPHVPHVPDMPDRPGRLQCDVRESVQDSLRLLAAPRPI